MRHLIPYLKKYRLEAIIAPLFKMFEACFDLAVPIVVANIIKKGIETGDRSYILSRFAILILMAFSGLACTVVAQYFAAKAAVGTATGLRHQLLEIIVRNILSFCNTLYGDGSVLTMYSQINQRPKPISSLRR